ASGLRRQRRRHVLRALITVLLLGITVWAAFGLSAVRDFPADEMAIHKVFSRGGGLMVFPLAFTGLMLWRRPAWRRAHQVCIGLFLVLALGATVTGVWVLVLSTPKI